MAFHRLTLHHFRHYAEATFELAPRAQAFVGPNGVGKTSLLEAAHYLALGKGFATDKDALRHGESFFQVEGAWASEGDSVLLACGFQLGRGRRISYDGQPLRRLADHVGRCPVVAILPDDVDLVREAAAVRRAWLDALLCQAYPHYLAALIAYERALTQLNALYQSALAADAAPDPEQIELWQAPLVQYGQVIAADRRAFLGGFAAAVQARYAALVPEGAEPIDLVYATSIATNAPDEWAEGLRAGQASARATGRCRYGTHRDDVSFVLAGHPLRGSGSQGQLKSFVLALKLAQHAFLQQTTGRHPLLLLDDVFERLDAQRSERLFALLAQGRGQVLLTDTDPARVKRALAAFGAADTATTVLG